MRKIRVLFLCADNSVQSPIAEALLNKFDSEHFEAMSAGIERGETHPLTVKAMSDIGIDLEKRTAKAIDDISGLHFDFVITLCERARAQCPAFPEAELVHWRFDDPLVAVDQTKQEHMFQSLRDQMAQRIHLFALVQIRPYEAHARARHTPRFQSDLVHS